MVIPLVKLRQQLQDQAPFSYLPANSASGWLEKGKMLRLEPGQTLVSNRKLQDRIYLVIDGTVRLLVEQDDEIITLSRRGPGQFIGWASLLRAEA